MGRNPITIDIILCTYTTIKSIAVFQVVLLNTQRGGKVVVEFNLTAGNLKWFFVSGRVLFFHSFSIDQTV